MKQRSLQVLLLVVSLTLVADQVTKYLAVAHLTDVMDGREGVARVSAFLSERNLDNEPPVEGARRHNTRPYHFIEDYWHFRYVENPGAAWGIFGNLPDGVRQGFFHLVSLAALAFIFTLYRRTTPEQGLMRVALSLVAGGALGNFVDRLMRGYVIDFIDWHLNDAAWHRPTLHWPTFNVADSGITVGLAMLFLEMLFARKPAGAAEGKQSA
jgi:signal peptidase II